MHTSYIRLFFLAIALSLLFVFCKNEQKVQADAPQTTQKDNLPAKSDGVTSSHPVTPTPASQTSNLPEEWADITDLDPSILLDIRYATANNFTEAQIYDCPACLLRPKVAKAVVKIHQDLQKQSLGLKMFDCYRPAPYQQRLWDKVPDPRYVMHPKKGSQHSRGAAVDLTIVDSLGVELDMGTPYDFFGEEAHHPFKNLPEEVLNNRLLLKNTMEAAGFRSIRTEWWHYSLKGNSYELSDFVWDCQ